MSGEFSGGGIINNSVVQTGEGNAMQNVTTGRNARVNIVMSQPQTPSAAIRNLREVLTEHYGQVDSAAVRAELDNLGKELRAGEIEHADSGERRRILARLREIVEPVAPLVTAVTQLTVAVLGVSGH